ncbi:ribosomal RNA small subunit methyltransferase E [Jeotgalicoccus coquinae]|uniref:Ribosomal RNA small subunit methyltransferase E n=1 Tax=Jeotgalicoccus coquinae TaxID=709509 RepID=A0A6V7RAM9_9STAP|nr:RsmE family RNA methyltransferase [Jeotgalicoccus coquinae]MBB6422832.1 16S rRNA (uracil1498-N3)-methyltransferase [Jeotgalicoccus coquinae]GGE12834.1 ribosomal RNA small subunit methyltransferase E [Jeotgalicoccus coquinae]CAD2074018.1 Ribosomal RNA small subunit methyltransferase E [Jeotgalicoccus coquinae]
MQRYFIEGTVSLNESFVMDDAHIHHIKNVMRAKADDEFNVVDSTGNAYLVRLTDIDPVTYEVIEKINAEVELPVNITLYSPLLKGDKMDVVIQKSTELGAHEFILYKADRSVVKLNSKKEESRLVRYEKIAREASEQSRRTKIPAISFAGALKAMDFTQYDLVLFAYEDNNLTGRSIKDVLKAHNAASVAVVFGPEGGFTEAEAEFFRPYENVALGRRILRAETAPLYALSVIGSYYE